MGISDVVNLDLLAQPYNWVLVILILVGFVMVMTMIGEPLNQIGSLLPH
jgi:hypothetical protein